MYQLVDCDFIVNWLRYLRFKFRRHYLFRSIRLVWEFLDKIIYVFTLLSSRRFDRCIVCLFSSRIGQNLDRRRRTRWTRDEVHQFWKNHLIDPLPSCFNSFSCFWSARANQVLPRQLFARHRFGSGDAICTFSILLQFN